MQPVRTRCGVMTHQARAMMARREGGHVIAVAKMAIAAAAAAMSQSRPRV